MRILYWPLRSPLSASKRLPGNAARFFSEVAASKRSSLRRRALKPRKCSDSFPGSEISGPLISRTDDHSLSMSVVTRYVKRNPAGRHSRPRGRCSHGESSLPVLSQLKEVNVEKARSPLRRPANLHVAGDHLTENTVVTSIVAVMRRKALHPTKCDGTAEPPAALSRTRSALLA